MARPQSDGTAVSQLSNLEEKANAHDWEWYVRIAMASLLIFLLLQIVSNIERIATFMRNVSPSAWSSESLSGWDTRTGIANGEATAIVTALAAIIISINVTAIVTSLTPASTEADEHALYRWLSKMESLAPTAASAAIAVSCTRLGTDTGLGVGLLMVASIAMGASTLNAVARARRFGARVRAVNARRDAAAAKFHVETLVVRLAGESQRQWWGKVATTYTYSLQLLLLVSGFLALETLIQCLTTPDWIYVPQVDTFAEIAFVSGYMFLANSMSTGPLLLLLAWTRKWTLILGARRSAGVSFKLQARLMNLMRFIEPLVALVVIALITGFGQVLQHPADQIITASMLLSCSAFYCVALLANRGVGPSVNIPLHALAHLQRVHKYTAKAQKDAEDLEEAVSAFSSSPADNRNVTHWVARIKFWR